MITYLVFIVWASLEGIKDAFTFSEKWKKVNIHGLLLTSRCAVGYLAVKDKWEIFLINRFEWEIFFNSIAFTAMLALAFPFFQLSAYYITYKMLGHPHFNFFTDKSPTSNAKISFGFVERFTGLILSIIIGIYLLL